MPDIPGIPPELLELFESNAEDSDAGHNNDWKLEAIKGYLENEEDKINGVTKLEESFNADNRSDLIMANIDWL